MQDNKGLNQDRPEEESRRDNPRPHTLICIGTTTARRHATHEEIRERRESHRDVTMLCHAAHTRGATRERNKRKRCGHGPGANASMLQTTLARPAPTTEQPGSRERSRKEDPRPHTTLLHREYNGATTSNTRKGIRRET